MSNISEKWNKYTTTENTITHIRQLSKLTWRHVSILKRRCVCIYTGALFAYTQALSLYIHGALSTSILRHYLFTQVLFSGRQNTCFQVLSDICGQKYHHIWLCHHHDHHHDHYHHHPFDPFNGVLP